VIPYADLLRVCQEAGAACFTRAPRRQLSLFVCSLFE